MLSGKSHWKPSRRPIYGHAIWVVQTDNRLLYLDDYAQNGDEHPKADMSAKLNKMQRNYSFTGDA